LLENLGHQWSAALFTKLGSSFASWIARQSKTALRFLMGKSKLGFSRKHMETF